MIKIIYFLTEKGKKAALLQGITPSWKQVYVLYPPEATLPETSLDLLVDPDACLNDIRLGELITAIKSVLQTEQEETSSGVNTTHVVGTTKQWALASQLATIKSQGESVIHVEVESFYSSQESVFKIAGVRGKADNQDKPVLRNRLVGGGFDQLLSLDECLSFQQKYTDAVAKWRDEASTEARQAIQTAFRQRFDAELAERLGNQESRFGDYKDLPPVAEYLTYLNREPQIDDWSNFNRLEREAAAATREESLRRQKAREEAEVQEKIRGAVAWINTHLNPDEYLKMLVEEGFFAKQNLREYRDTRLETEHPGWQVVPYGTASGKYKDGRVPKEALQLLREARTEFPSAYLHKDLYGHGKTWYVIADWEGIKVRLPLDG